ncbi:hypothetical protein Q7O_002864 [Pectobacterium carotovorum subsp. carotovorum PCCS1]|nr:hypothetical protein [Pectobacterium carotovorum subsp. carotovorum PCCS1]
MINKYHQTIAYYNFYPEFNKPKLMTDYSFVNKKLNNYAI